MLSKEIDILLKNNIKHTYSQHFSRETVVNDIQGRPMPAVLVLAMTLRYLQQHAVRLITHHRPDIRENDIQYVITIPPEWNDSAKGLMREAAFEVNLLLCSAVKKKCLF